MAASPERLQVEIVDDDPGVTAILSVFLNTDKRVTGIKIQHNPETSLSRLEREILLGIRPDIVYSDFNFQDESKMTGVEYLTEVRNLSPDIALIIVTSDIGMSVVQDAIGKLNMVMGLGKPFRMAQIIDSVDKSVEWLAQRPR